MIPLFSNKVSSNTYITLNEDGKLIKNGYQIAKMLNTFFVEIVPNLGTKVMKDIYVTLATFLTQLKNLYKNIKMNRVSLSSKKRYLLSIKIISFPSSLLLRMIFRNKLKAQILIILHKKVIYVQSW